MNKKFLIRLLLDAIMTVIMILLMEYHITGLFLHEVLGLAILATILIHNLLNTKWIVGIYRRIFYSRTKSSTNAENTLTSRKLKLPIGKLILNLLLLIDTLVLGISGILISKELFPFLRLTKDTFLWKQLHTLSSYWMIILIGIHLGLHWKMIMGAARQIFRIKKPNQGRSIFLRIVAFLFAILGVKASFDRGLYQNLVPFNAGNNKPKSEDSITEHMMKGNDPKPDGNSSTSGDKGKPDGERPAYGRREGSGKGHGHGNTNEERTFTETPPSSEQSESDYLDSLTCTGCGRRCSLLTPQCSTGESQAKQASAYYQEYVAGDSSSTNDAAGDTAGDSSSTSDVADMSPNKISLSFQGNNEDLCSLFLDYVPILSLFIAGSYYSLEIINKGKKIKKDSTSKNV